MSRSSSSFTGSQWRARTRWCGTKRSKLSGADPDFHRRDLWEAIESGAYPEYELNFQIITEEQAEKFSFDILDATKLVPEEVSPLISVGQMTLNSNPDNFFAETEQVASCTAHVTSGRTSVCRTFGMRSGISEMPRPVAIALESRPLSLFARPGQRGIAARRIAIMVADGVDGSPRKGDRRSPDLTGRGSGLRFAALGGGR
jgi:hypothetical protein